MRRLISKTSSKIDFNQHQWLFVEMMRRECVRQYFLCESFIPLTKSTEARCRNAARSAHFYGYVFTGGKECGRLHKIVLWSIRISFGLPPTCSTWNDASTHCHSVSHLFYFCTRTVCVLSESIADCLED